jgi:lysophospholipase L1-like esterase
MVRALNPDVSEGRSEWRAFGRLGGLLAGLVAAIAATYVAPVLHPLRPWVPGGDYVPFWNVVGREWLGEGKLLEAETAKLAELQRQTETAARTAPTPRKSAPPPVPTFPAHASETKVEPPEHGIEPPEALDHYFRKLTLADLGVPGAIARAGHWGDSVLGVDGITSAIRRRLQTRFGDAGHGFHLMDRYNPSYRQQGIEFEPGTGWSRCLVVNECKKQDRRYGYGGLTVSSGGTFPATWRTPKKGFGQTVSVFELWFAHQEKGGDVEIVIDGKDKITVSTRGPHLEDGWHRLSVPAGRHSFSVRAAGGGNVRAYGVVLENDGPGVVWDGMALIGGSSRGLRTQHPDHIASQIRHRDLDLIVFMFGGNDMERNYVDLTDSMQLYYDEYGDVLKHFRAGKPEAACLIMSVTDHGKRMADNSIQSRKFAKQLSKAQREVARQNGCGFFDTYEAMGGTGTAARWFRAGLLAPDLGHPTGAGHEVIAGLVANAILHGYEEYRRRMVGKPLPELDTRLAATGGAGEQGDRSKETGEPQRGSAEGAAAAAAPVQ